MKLTVEPLDKKKHDRQSFNCGLPIVNQFLETQASRQMGQKINRTWVLTNKENLTQSKSPIIGFFTLTTATVVRDELPDHEPKSRYPQYPMPVYKLAWLGVDARYQKLDIRAGELLLLEALEQACLLSAHSGLGMAIVTDPLTEHSDAFFKKYGFTSMASRFREHNSLYLPINTARKLFG